MKAWLELARISNLPTAWTNVLAGWLLAGGQLQDQRLVWLLLGASLLYCGGMILNDAADAGYDREHRKERPIPRGAVSVGAAWGGGMMLLFLGGNISTAFARADLRITAALIVAILAYDLYHKPWPGSVIVMGACRTLLYMVAGSVLLGGLSGWFTRQPKAGSYEASQSLLHCSIVIGAYIVGLTMVARMEAKRSDSSRRATVLISKLLLCSPGILAAARVFMGGDPATLIILLAFAFLITTALRMMKRGGAEIGRAVGWLLAGIALVDALAVSQVSFSLACMFAASVPLLRLWQRKIAAT